MPRLTDYTLSRILIVQQKLDDIIIELDDIIRCKELFLDIHEKYVAYKVAVTNAQNNITQWLRAFRAEPCMAQLLDTLEEAMRKSALVQENDPAVILVCEYCEEVEQIIAHGRKPWVRKLNEAEKAVLQWEEYMMSDDVQYILAQAARTKPIDNNNKPKAHMLTDEEKEWKAYMLID
jgi:hypothetical protein